MLSNDIEPKYPLTKNALILIDSRCEILTLNIFFLRFSDHVDLNII